VALAVLLSLSSIAAIGGLVAISVGRLDPAPDGVVTTPIETAAAAPPIRVVAPGPDSREDSAPREEAASADEPPPPEPVAPPPAPAAPPTAPSGGEEAADERNGGGGGKGGGRRPWGLGGAWCDAEAGGSCDVAVGGSVLQPTGGEGGKRGRGSAFDSSAFLRVDGEDLDGSEEDSDDDHPKGKHGKHH
jgi:hypothetical protein